jgi:ribosomal protein S18 acetylase RimI-like enzyme
MMMIELRPLRDAPTAASDAIMTIARGLPEWFTERGLEQLRIDIAHQAGYIATREDRVLGFVTYYVAEGVAHIGWLGVAKSEHRGGVGRRLIDHLCARLHDAGLPAVHVDTLGDSVDYAPYALPRAFYRAVGFEDHQRVRQDDPEWPDRLTMRRQLRGDRRVLAETSS